MRFLHFILYVTLLLAAQPATAKLFNVESFTLSNGLQVVVIPNPRAPVVSHMIWYKFGAADERPGESGIAHFLEHLMFKGTPSVPDGAFSRTVRKLGGNDNAFTSHDYTAYYQNVPRRQLERVMEMEADRMKNLELREDQVASEREVIVEERRQRVDNNPSSMLQEQLMAALFVNHPYSMPVIGWLHEIRKYSRDLAFDYYDQWYAPNNAVLVVAGDVTAADMKTLAQKYYGAIPPQTIPDRIRAEPAPIVADTRVILQDERVGPPVITKTYRAPRGDDAVRIVAEIIGGNSTARLYRHLVVERRIAISAGASYDPYSLDASTFTVYASPTPNTPVVELEAAMDAEINTLLQKGVTAGELASAKARDIAGRTYYLDSLQGPALLFGRAVASGFSVDDVNNTDSRTEKLTAADIARAAQQVFGGKPVTGLLLPVPKKEAAK